MAKKEIELCDRDCNNCPIITHPNSRMVTYILNSLYEKMSDGGCLLNSPTGLPEPDLLL